MRTSDRLIEIFESAGDGLYFGEALSIREHSLQSAHFASLDKAPNELILAALLHDIGHLLNHAPNELAEWTTDAHHENSGSTWLARYYPPAISEPVRLHVAAKRYLCATTPAYIKKLSDASVTTLSLQGGIMSAAEVKAFEAQPFAQDAVCLRLWDDKAKVPNLKTSELVSYRELMDQLASH
jgi:phosphonate degradation associated HDIG domain protein